LVFYLYGNKVKAKLGARVVGVGPGHVRSVKPIAVAVDVIIAKIIADDSHYSYISHNQ